MTAHSLHTFLVAAACLLVSGCTDGLMPSDSDLTLQEDGTPHAILIDSEEGYYTLPTGMVAHPANVSRADFLTLTADGRIYFERNDDAKTRTARVSVQTADGQPDELLFSQPPATRTGGSQMCQFYRHHGIGYSYNAVNGNYCNLRDFRCQILNRAVIDRIAEETGQALLNVNTINQMEREHRVYTSVVDYIAEVNVDASASGDLVFFSGSTSKACAIFEEGEMDSYILHDELSSVNAEYSINYNDVALCAKDNPTMLTSSFRNAVSKITDFPSVDDFIYAYGTHVVVFSRIGASIALDIQIDTHKFESKEFEKSLSEATIATLFKSASSSEAYERNYKTMKDARCSFTVKGGNVSLFDPLVGIANFDNKSVPKDLDLQWLGTIRFDDEDLSQSNVELIGMRVVPIWKFITDKKVASLVEARVTGNMKQAMDMVSNRNFINTTFKAHPTDVWCRIGNDANQCYNHPDVVDIVASNRHVATVCREYVPEISATEKVQVAYPIYEGRVKLSNGLCLYGDRAYSVDWRYNKFVVTELKIDGRDPSDEQIYMNYGVLSLVKSTNVDYQSSKEILGCERPGGIGIDGSLQGEMRRVFKHFGHFYLDNKQRYDNLPGWEYVTTAAEEEETYPTYFEPGTYQNRMRRAGNYVYMLNPTEIGY